MLRELLTRPHARKKSGSFVAEGVRMVSETPPDMIEEIYISESFAGSAQDLGEPVSALIRGAELVDDKVFRSVSDTVNPQGIMAVVRQKSCSVRQILELPDPLILFLENIQDPGNLGTMIRTAEGAGATGIIMSRDTADVYNPKVVRSTMGSLYRMPFAYADDLCEAVAQARDGGTDVYAAYLSGSVCYTEADYTKGCAFLIGNEGSGLTAEAARAATACVRIPMAGKLESLNAAAAASILLYEAARQRM